MSHLARPNFSRSMVGFCFTVLTTLSALTIPSTADAQSFHSLRRASDEYRSATQSFERHVHRAGYFDHYDKRLVGRLEDVASDFRSAARNTNDVRRLLFHWNELTAIHPRVQQTLVVGCGRPDPELIRCWEQVAIAFECLVTEMQCFAGRGIPYESRRPVYDDFRHAPAPNPGFHPGHPGFHPGNFGAGPDIRRSTPPFAGSRGAEFNSRQDAGAAIAAMILSRLFN